MNKQHTHCFCGEVLSGAYGRTSTCCQAHSQLLENCGQERKKARKKLKKINRANAAKDYFLLGRRNGGVAS